MPTQLRGSHVQAEKENERQNVRSGPGRSPEKPPLGIRMASCWAFQVGTENTCLCHSLVYIPKPRLWGQTPRATEPVPSSGPARL